MTTETAQMTIAQFVERHGITLAASKIPLVSWWEGDKQAQSWQCTLKCGPREMSINFTKGSAHRVWRRLPHSSFDGTYSRPRDWKKDVKNSTREHFRGMPARLPWNPSKYDREAFFAWTDPEPPNVAEVLDSLVSDASGADQSFEDWCSDYGYDTDSRKAERTYDACREVMFNLRKLLGMRDFEALLNDVERM